MLIDFFLKLWGFVRYLFVRKRTDLYSPTERLIFRYHDGTKIIRADPLELYKKVMDVAPDLDIAIKLANSLHSDAKKGQEEAIATINGIFGLRPLDQEGGVTGIETMGIYDRFWEFCDSIKKNSRVNPTSAVETSPGMPGCDANDLITRRTAASGSTASESSNGQPIPLPTEQQSASASSTRGSTFTEPTPTEKEKLS